jgi:hypothetical protein
MPKNSVSWAVLARARQQRRKRAVLMLLPEDLEWLPEMRKNDET